MDRTVTAVFDGEVLHPDLPLDLEPNTRYVLIIQSEPVGTAVEDVWAVLERLTGTVDAPADWSSEHDHYLYGTPKRQDDSST